MRADKTVLPLEPERLRALALAYVARFATTGARLKAYLARKIKERGWHDPEDFPDLEALVEQFESLGYLDDASYAAQRSGALMRQGYGARRVRAALTQAGVARDLIAMTVETSEEDRFAAALRFARRRRLGPFGSANADDGAQQRRALGAMLRAGHELDVSLRILKMNEIPKNFDEF